VSLKIKGRKNIAKKLWEVKRQQQGGCGGIISGKESKPNTIQRIQGTQRVQGIQRTQRIQHNTIQGEQMKYNTKNTRNTKSKLQYKEYNTIQGEQTKYNTKKWTLLWSWVPDYKHVWPSSHRSTEVWGVSDTEERKLCLCNTPTPPKLVLRSKNTLQHVQPPPQHRQTWPLLMPCSHCSTQA